MIQHSTWKATAHSSVRYTDCEIFHLTYDKRPFTRQKIKVPHIGDADELLTCRLALLRKKKYHLKKALLSLSFMISIFIQRTFIPNKSFAIGMNSLFSTKNIGFCRTLFCIAGRYLRIVFEPSLVDSAESSRTTREGSKILAVLTSINISVALQSARF